MSNIRTIISNNNTPSHIVPIVRITFIYRFYNLHITSRINQYRRISTVIGQIMIKFISSNISNIDKTTSRFNLTDYLQNNSLTNSKPINVNNSIGITTFLQNRININKTIRQDISHHNTSCNIRTIIRNRQLPSNQIIEISLRHINLLNNSQIRSRRNINYFRIIIITQIIIKLTSTNRNIIFDSTSLINHSNNIQLNILIRI